MDVPASSSATRSVAASRTCPAADAATDAVTPPPPLAVRAGSAPDLSNASAAIALPLHPAHISGVRPYSSEQFTSHPAATMARIRRASPC